MRPAQRARAPSPRTAGFSLIELAAVVLVIALLFGFVLPNFGVASRRALDSDAEQLRASLELARQRSIATGVEHRVAIDLDGARYHIEGFEKPPAKPPSSQPPEREERRDRNERRRHEVSPLLLPPAAPGGSFVPIPTKLGRATHLNRDVTFTRIETAEGIHETGTVGVAFLQDGSATPALITLRNADGDGLELQVLPLADTVRVNVDG